MCLLMDLYKYNWNIYRVTHRLGCCNQCLGINFSSYLKCQSTREAFRDHLHLSTIFQYNSHRERYSLQYVYQSRLIILELIELILPPVLPSLLSALPHPQSSLFIYMSDTLILQYYQNCDCQLRHSFESWSLPFRSINKGRVLRLKWNGDREYNIQLECYNVNSFSS